MISNLRGSGQYGLVWAGVDFLLIFFSDLWRKLCPSVILTGPEFREPEFGECKWMIKIFCCSVFEIVLPNLISLAN